MISGYDYDYDYIYIYIYIYISCDEVCMQNDAPNFYFVRIVLPLVPMSKCVLKCFPRLPCIVQLYSTKSSSLPSHFSPTCLCVVLGIFVSQLLQPFFVLDTSSAVRSSVCGLSYLPGATCAPLNGVPPVSISGKVCCKK